MSLVLGINFKQTKQLVLRSVVCFRRKPRGCAVYKVTALSSGGMVRNAGASDEQVVRPVTSEPVTQCMTCSTPPPPVQLSYQWPSLEGNVCPVLPLPSLGTGNGRS